MTAPRTVPPLIDPIDEQPRQLLHWTLHRGKMALAVIGLLTAMVVSAVAAIGFGTATINPSDTVSYLQAGITGASISEQEDPQYQIIWQINTLASS